MTRSQPATVDLADQPATVDLADQVYHDVLRLRNDYAAATGNLPWFLVLDGESYLALLKAADTFWERRLSNHEIGHEYRSRGGEIQGGLAGFMTMTVVVIPTDGIRMVKVVGPPWEEAIMLQLPAATAQHAS